MIVGVFSPVINWCGGAEWVAINMMKILKKEGHQVIILTDKALDQKKLKRIFNITIKLDRQIILPFRFFPSSDYRNIYTDFIRSLILKTKCDLLLDTFSNGLLPGMDIVYIHHPLLKQAKEQLTSRLNKIYFYPYKNYLKSQRTKLHNKLILANSKFTANAIIEEIGIKPIILYPPAISNENLKVGQLGFSNNRNNNVITVSRISRTKNLEIIPHIANLTDEKITFTIIGLLDSKNVLNKIKKIIQKFDVSHRVNILPNASRSRLKKIMINSKIILHTTPNEHFGISIIEGMSMGCIPIVHGSGGPQEFVSKNLQYKTINEAAEKITNVISRWSPIQAIKSSNEVSQFTQHNFKTQFKKIFNSYIEILNK